MGDFLLSGYVTIHLNDQKVQRGLNFIHKLHPDTGVIMTPFPDAFPSVPVLSAQIRLRLKQYKIVGISGYKINNIFKDDVVGWTLQIIPIFFIAVMEHLPVFR